MTIRSKLAIAAVAASVSAIAAPAFAAGTTFGLYGEVVGAPQVTSQVSRAEVRAEAQQASVDNVWLPDAQQFASTSDRTRAEVRAEGRSLTADDYSRRQAAVYAAVHG